MFILLFFRISKYGTNIIIKLMAFGFATYKTNSYLYCKPVTEIKLILILVVLTKCLSHCQYDYVCIKSSVNCFKTVLIDYMCTIII